MFLDLDRCRLEIAMNLFHKISMPGVLLGALACAAAAQTEGSSSQPKPAPAPPAPPMGSMDRIAHGSTPCRGSKLVGKSVVNAKGEKVGSLEDLFIEDSASLIAVIKRGDGQFAGVPMDQLTPAYDEQDGRATKPDDSPTLKEFRINAPADKLSSTPLINDVANIDATWLSRVREHYSGGGADSAGTAAANPAPAAAPAGNAATSKAMSPVCCVQKLVGAEVKNPRGERLGKIEDVAVSVSDAKVAYVVVASGNVPGMPGTLHGVAWKSLTADASGKACVIPTDKETLERSPGIDLDHLPPYPDLQVSAITLNGTGQVAQEPGRR
jgi:sporulation protein YlmC with PRC-barrel domain